MLRKNVEKRQMMKQLDGIFLAVDEICDRGIILEIEPNDVIDKVSICKYSYPISLGTINIYLTGRYSKRRYTADGANSCTSIPVSKGADQMVIVEIELLYICLLRINYNTQ